MSRRWTCALAVSLLSSGLVGVALPAEAANNALFAPYVALDPGSAAASVAIGDVTGDGRPDVVLTTDYDFDAAADFSVWTYPQQPDGSLGAPAQLALDAAYGSDMSVELADLDEDGDLDAAVTTRAGVVVLRQTGGALQRSWTVPIPDGRDLELADVSGDGLADLLVNTPTGIVVWWQIRGDLMPAPTGARLATNGSADLAVGDVTGDGLADVVSALGRQFEIRAQQPDHSFAAPVGYLSGGTSGWETVEGIAIADTTGDGRNDLHLSGGGNSPTGWVVTWPANATGQLTKPARYASYDVPETLEAGDVTGDGHDDLLVLHGGWNTLGVYDSTPGTMPVETRFPLPYASHYGADALAIGDVSGDGRADVAVADYNHGLVLLRGAAPGADVNPPETTILSGPSGVSYTRTATFTMASSEPGGFQCALDSQVFTTCGSSKTYQGLAEGNHTFRVRAIDPSGNLDATPDLRTFTLQGPETTITAATVAARSTSASFSFTASPAAASYQCRLDTTTWSACTAPFGALGLATGAAHTFEVRAVSGEGLVDPTPAVRTWTVDAAADLSLSSTASPTTVKRNGALTWTTTARNAGPDAASGVVVSQSVPSGLTGVTAAATVGSAAAACTVSASIARCEAPSIGAGGSLVLTVRGTNTLAKGSLTSTSSVTTTLWDRVATNNTVTTTTKVGNGK